MTEQQIIRALTEALLDALEFIENQSDVVDGPDGQPQANKAMSLVIDIDRTLEACNIVK